jgi:hypothetical protein
MNKIIQVGFLLALLLTFAFEAHASTIILSGDSNIINLLDGSAGEAINPGNQIFFRNILGSGTKVVVQNNCGNCAGSLATANATVNTFYGSLGGVTSTLLAGNVTSASLSGASLFVSILPATSFTSSELAALNGFGGTVFFLGENGISAFDPFNTNINLAIAGLGGSMSIIPGTFFDSGFQTAVGTHIASNPLTAGVTSFRYALSSEVSGGTTLFTGLDNQKFVAVQTVPEPDILMLIGFGLAALTCIRKQRQANF